MDEANNGIGRSQLHPQSGVVLASVLTILLVIPLVFALITIWMSPLGTTGCSPRCDTHTLTASRQAFFVLGPLSLPISVIGIVLLRRRGWWVLCAPAAAFLFLGVVFGVTFSLVEFALHA